MADVRCLKDLECICGHYRHIHTHRGHIYAQQVRLVHTKRSFPTASNMHRCPSHCDRVLYIGGDRCAKKARAQRGEAGTIGESNFSRCPFRNTQRPLQFVTGSV